jgi:hypothetical protein
VSWRSEEEKKKGDNKRKRRRIKDAFFVGPQ